MQRNRISGKTIFYPLIIALILLHLSDSALAYDGGCIEVNIEGPQTVYRDLKPGPGENSKFISAGIQTVRPSTTTTAGYMAHVACDKNNCDQLEWYYDWELNNIPQDVNSPTVNLDFDHPGNYILVVEVYDNAGDLRGYDQIVIAVGQVSQKRDLNFLIDLNQNYPNPFNPETEIQFTLFENHYVNLSIYNVSGQLVEILVDEQKPPGIYTVRWDSSNVLNRPVPSGFYFYRLKTDNGLSKTKRMVLLK